jgi:hypothetical protein
VQVGRPVLAPIDPARGVIIGTTEIGTGVDNIDYDEPRHFMLPIARHAELARGRPCGRHAPLTDAHRPAPG